MEGIINLRRSRMKKHATDSIRGDSLNSEKVTLKWSEVLESAFLLGHLIKLLLIISVIRCLFGKEPKNGLAGKRLIRRSDLI
jgi:hypothetical protein